MCFGTLCVQFEKLAPTELVQLARQQKAEIEELTEKDSQAKEIVKSLLDQVSVCVCVYMCVCVRVCVCVYERLGIFL